MHAHGFFIPVSDIGVPKIYSWIFLHQPRCRGNDAPLAYRCGCGQEWYVSRPVSLGLRMSRPMTPPSGRGDVINQSIVTVAQRTFVCHARFQCPSGQQHLVSTGLTGYSGCRLVRWWNARMWSAWASSNRSEEPKWIDSKEPKRTDSEDRRVTAGSGL